MSGIWVKYSEGNTGIAEDKMLGKLGKYAGLGGQRHKGQTLCPICGFWGMVPGILQPTSMSWRICTGMGQDCDGE